MGLATRWIGRWLAKIMNIIPRLKRVRLLLKIVLVIFGVFTILTAVMLGAARQVPHQSVWLIYSENGNRYRILPDGKESPPRLVCHDCDNLTGYLSPDGQWLVQADFGHYYNKPDNLTITYIFRNRARKLTEMLGQNKFEAFSPDSQWVYFQHSPAEEPNISDLYRVKITGGTPQQITHTPDLPERIMGWSADNQWIYFLIGEFNTAVGFGIGRMYPNGQNWELIAQPSQKIYFADVSPSGDWIVYTESDNSSVRLYRMKPDGTQIGYLLQWVILPHRNAPFHNYTWSPDGQWLFFTTDTGIMRLGVSDGQLKLMLDTPSFETLPTWRDSWRPIEVEAVSSDGLWLYFDMEGRLYDWPIIDDGLGISHSHDLHRIRTDGTSWEQLTYPLYYGYDPNSDFLLGWSPDGAWLAYCSQQGVHKTGDFIMRLDGTRARQIEADSVLGWAQFIQKRWSVWVVILVGGTAWLLGAILPFLKFRRRPHPLP